jgi:hypothetical protein
MIIKIKFLVESLVAKLGFRLNYDCRSQEFDPGGIIKILATDLPVTMDQNPLPTEVTSY